MMEEEPVSVTHMEQVDSPRRTRRAGSSTSVDNDKIPLNQGIMQSEPPSSKRSDYSYSSDGDHTAASDGSTAIQTQAPRSGPESLAPPVSGRDGSSSSMSSSGQGYSSDSDQTIVTEGSTVGGSRAVEEISRKKLTNDLEHPRPESRSGSQLSNKYDYSSDSDQGTISTKSTGQAVEPDRVTGSERETLAVADGNSSRASSKQSQYNYSTDSDQVSVTAGSTHELQKEPQSVARPELSPESANNEIHTAGKEEQMSANTTEPADERKISSSETSLNDPIAGKKKAHFVEDQKGREKDEEPYVPSAQETHVSSEDFVARSKRQNSEASLSSQSRPSGRRHSGLTRATYNNRPQNVRHYSTLSGGSGHDRQGGGDNVSIHSASSRNSGLFSIFNYMTERFIYETDPFEGTLRKCPRLTFHVVDKATSPVSIEILFGNPERRALPSYYYTSTGEKNMSAKSRRGTSARVGSRQGSVSPPGSVIDARSYLPLDSSLDYRRETDGFILEEEEDKPRVKGKKPARGPRSGRAGTSKSAGTKTSGGSRSPQREGTLPDIYVSDHTLSASPRGHQDDRRDKRPVTSWSNKTNRSIGLPGKPIMAS